MSGDQAKFTHQLILVITTFLRLLNEHEEKTHVCHPISRAVSEIVIG